MPHLKCVPPPCWPFPAHSGHVVLSSALARRRPRRGNLPGRYAGSRDGDCIRRIRRSSVTPCAGVSSVVRFVVPTWGPSPPCATRVAAPRASAVLPSHSRSVCPGTPAHRPGPPGGPMLLRAIAPCSLFRHTMATLVVPLVSLLRVPSDWGCLCSQCTSVYQHLDLLPPPDALRPQATRSFLATAYHVRPLNTVPGHPLSRPRHRSRRRHSSGAVPHVSDGHRPVRRC